MLRLETRAPSTLRQATRCWTLSGTVSPARSKRRTGQTVADQQTGRRLPTALAGQLRPLRPRALRPGQVPCATLVSASANAAARGPRNGPWWPWPANYRCCSSNSGGSRCPISPIRKQRRSETIYQKPLRPMSYADCDHCERSSTNLDTKIATARTGTNRAPNSPNRVLQSADGSKKMGSPEWLGNKRTAN